MSYSRRIDDRGELDGQLLLSARHCSARILKRQRVGSCCLSGRALPHLQQQYRKAQFPPGFPQSRYGFSQASRTNESQPLRLHFSQYRTAFQRDHEVTHQDSGIIPGHHPVPFMPAFASTPCSPRSLAPSSRRYDRESSAFVCRSARQQHVFKETSSTTLHRREALMLAPLSSLLLLGAMGGVAAPLPAKAGAVGDALKGVLLGAQVRMKSACAGEHGRSER